ncbi:glycoside hydrolase family 13 protein, partial [Streptococcus danieliae]|nr:glycoside hydrolase family 13 protein [Streptococcus danieliae]
IYGEKNSVLAKWNQLGVDGWRLDVADELPDPFIAKIRKNLDGYRERLLLGEVWEDASNKVAYSQRRHYVKGDELDGVMNYPLREAILDLLAQKRSAET